MKGIMKIVQAIEDSNILLKGVTKTTNNETKEQKGGLLNMLLGTSGTSLLNLDEYADIGTHWIDLFCNRNEIVYFDSFGVEHVPEEIKEFVGNKNIIANIFRVQANNSIMCGYFCIGFIDFMLAGKKLTDFNSFFLPMTLKRMKI